MGVTATVADALTLTPITTGFNTPVGIDYHEPSNKVVMSVNYPSGFPSNFELVAGDGSRTPFSSISGLTEELKLATVRSGPCQGGFATGELFTGNGHPGQIVRVAPDGSSIQNPWVTLPDDGLLRGSLFQDRYCAAGGDLVVVTTTGGVFRITSAGVAVKLADTNTHLEGVTTLPNDPARYGPWAGMIVAGAEDQGLFWRIDPNTGAATSFNLGIRPEDLDVIPANENFFGVDFGAARLMGAPASEFCAMRGDLAVAQEGGPGILWHVHWDGTQFVTTNLATVSQWEHVTFAPVGIVEIPAPPSITIDDVTVNEDAGTATFTVKLSHPVSGPCPDTVSVDFDTSDASATAPGDYLSQSGTLAFGPGEDTTTVTVPIVDDAINEPTERFFVDLTNPAGASIDDDRGIGTILDDEAPPVCSTVTTEPLLWPPNHKYRLVTLAGATDPDGDTVTLTVTGVTQDEPLNGLGDGDTAPDAKTGPASNQVWLRAERSGTGDGRVYRISFTGSDGHGGTCSGSTTVGVPHDQGKGATPADSGLTVDSFGP
jgi:hypothetical protein